ncbi:hypothetical protein ACEV76_09605 [Vibrio parahaemolyticus]|uniref:hypothetical protein n=1 Tax=Vibrio harveyi group TaxID=717610 RepID=UPI000A3C1782|nr:MULTISPECIES: hypothetical protein [Vibrio harveyi group]MBS9854925.1 hypothetical protein [Vibrio alginolyticus]MCR9572503.1 hypothetical protein [Vibrio alginolyticus]MCS0084768.1 hypothetical protein [Vibrio alginolyticus]OUJ55036.1 hypothetical protein BTO03_22410 [Vibrio parahaemolyticus]TOA32372.1 hypothetical protein CGK28_23005 [Vibrio parahaemolyticus]
MISFTEDMLNIMLPIVKKYHMEIPIAVATEFVEYRVVAVNSSFMDFESNGVLVSVEVGGKLLLENGASLEYVIKNGTAILTELAKSELLTNSF